MLTWETHNDGKNHGIPQAAEYTMGEKITTVEAQGQRPLALLSSHELSFFYLLLDLVIPALDMLRPRVVCRVLCKVDGTLTVAIESVFILSDTELTDEVLHP